MIVLSQEWLFLFINKLYPILFMLAFKVVETTLTKKQVSYNLLDQL